MKSRQFCRHRSACAAAALAVACLLLSPAVHVAVGKGKPGGGGGGGGGGGAAAGTVYFWVYSLTLSNWQVHTMNPDGSGIQPLPPNIRHAPSRELHGGHRWFIAWRAIPDLFRPDGETWYELFAVRDDGDEDYTVQLTFQPRLEPVGHIAENVWLSGDSLISFQGIHWDLETGQPLEVGIYVAGVDFDEDGNVVGLAWQPDPADPAVSVPPVLNEDRDPATIDGFDWSPDGTQLAWAWNDRLLVTDLVLGTETAIVTADSPAAPVWSPDGSRIAFDSGVGIETIRPDGSDAGVVQRHKKNSFLRWVKWSPDSQYLIANQIKYSGGLDITDIDMDVVRFSADGGGIDNLTEGAFFQAVPLGWR